LLGSDFFGKKRFSWELEQKKHKIIKKTNKPTLDATSKRYLKQMTSIIRYDLGHNY
jgi:hypothetical protein